jgi:hypothetical protein
MEVAMGTRWKSGLGRLGVLSAAALLLGAAEVAEYRPHSRPAGELAPIANGLLGSEGGAVADPAGRALLLRGEPEAIGRTLELLRSLDVRAPTYRVESVLTRLSELRRIGVEVEGWTEIGPIRLGRVSAPVPAAAPGGGEPGVEVRIGALRVMSETRVDGLVTVLDGRSAELWTGALQLETTRRLRARGGEVRIEETSALVPVRTGLRVTPRGQPDGTVELEIAPVLSERGPDGVIIRSAAASRNRIRVDELVAVARAAEAGSAASIDPFGGAERRAGSRDSTFLIRVRRLD